MRMMTEPYIPPSNGVCKRGCCWTPYGCAKNQVCPCHPRTYNNYLKEKEKEDG